MFANFACVVQRKTLRLLAILDRMGVDVRSAGEERDGRRLLAATRVCMTCGDVGRCDAWLKTDPEPLETAPSFCPNASFLAHQAVWPRALPVDTPTALPRD